jgi:hypothetical protein
MGQADDGAERPPVRFSGTGAIDPYLAQEFARVLGIDDPVHRDRAVARLSGHRDVIVPSGQLFLATRAGDGEPPREATGLPEGFNAVVTGIHTEYFKPVEAGQAFTVRVRRLPPSIAPTARVRQFHQVEYELTDNDGDVAVRQRLTVAEFED